MKKSNLVFAIIGIVLVSFTILFYLVVKRYIPLEIPFIQKNIPYPQVTVMENAEDIGGIWVWLNEIEVQQSDDTYYLVGKLENQNKTLVKVLLGQKAYEVGFATSDNAPLTLSSEFPDYYPTWKVITADLLSIETSNFDRAAVHIHTKLNLPPSEIECDTFCQQYIDNLELLLPSNQQIFQDTRNLDQITVGPAVQILFFNKNR